MDSIEHRAASDRAIIAGDPTSELAADFSGAGGDHHRGM